MLPIAIRQQLDHIQCCCLLVTTSSPPLTPHPHPLLPHLCPAMSPTSCCRNFCAPPPPSPAGDGTKAQQAQVGPVSSPSSEGRDFTYSPSFPVVEAGARAVPAISITFGNCNYVVTRGQSRLHPRAANVGAMLGGEGCSFSSCEHLTEYCVLTSPPLTGHLGWIPFSL